MGNKGSKKISTSNDLHRGTSKQVSNNPKYLSHGTDTGGQSRYSHPVSRLPPLMDKPVGWVGSDVHQDSASLHSKYPAPDQNVKLKQLKQRNKELNALNEQMNKEMKLLAEQKNRELQRLAEQKNQEQQCLAEEKNRELKLLTEQKNRELKLLAEEKNKELMLLMGEKNKLQKQNTELSDTHQRLQDQIKDLSNRLSAEMGKKLAQDESSLENISIKNRPMNIAEDYENLCSNEWLTAKEYVDRKGNFESELEKVQLLSDVILVAEEVAAEFYLDVMERTECQLRRLPIFNPTSKQQTDKTPEYPDMESTGDSDTTQSFQLPLELTNVVRDIMRKRSATTKKDSLVKAVRKQIDNKYKEVVKKKKLTDYVKKCCNLAWDMKLQTPQMRFNCDGVGKGWKGEGQQDVYYRSADPNNPQHKVGCYVHPALYHNTKLMTRGRVYIMK